MQIPFLASLRSAGTSVRLIGDIYWLLTDQLTLDLSLPNTCTLNKVYHNFCRSRFSWPKHLFHVVTDATIFHAGMKIVNAVILATVLKRLGQERHKSPQRQSFLSASRTSTAGHGVLLTTSLTTPDNSTTTTTITPATAPISAKPLASQVITNETYTARDRKSDRLVKQEVSELCRTIASSDNFLTEDFISTEFDALLKIKPGKVLGQDHGTMAVDQKDI